MTTILSANGLIEIPEIFRKEDALQTGARCEVERVGRKEYRVRVDEGDAQVPEERLIDILLNCPVKGWFEPMDRTETTDDLKPGLFA